MKTDAPAAPILRADAREEFVRDGYIRVSGLFDRMGVNPDAPNTWTGKNMNTDPDAIAFTEACRTPQPAWTPLDWSLRTDAPGSAA